jgi:hypothetical protein
VVCGADGIAVFDALHRIVMISRLHRFFDLPHGISLDEVAAIIGPTGRTEHCEPMNSALRIEDRAICYTTSRGR